MALNKNPPFANAPLLGFIASLAAGNTSYDGTGTASLLFTAGEDGDYIDRILLQPKGTNVASVARLFFVTGADNSVAANNCLMDEVGLPLTTASQVAALTGSAFLRAAGSYVPAGTKVYVTLGTTVAGGYSVSAWRGNMSG
jgi:hypothetical protein